MIGEKNENKIHTFEHTIYTQRNVFAGPNEHEKIQQQKPNIKATIHSVWNQQQHMYDTFKREARHIRK